MVDDLVEFAVSDVETAIRLYRQDPKSKYFPSPGVLRKLAGDERRERNKATKSRKLRTEWVEGTSRPIRWWGLPRTLWKQEWRETEVPMGEMVRDAKTDIWRAPERLV